MGGGGGLVDDPNLKGFSRYFNTITRRGRQNVAIASLTGWTMLFVYLFSGKKKKTIDAPPKTSLSHH
ncbi:unnamed protein product [Gordionus sp. m RMFG-2023]